MAGADITSILLTFFLSGIASCPGSSGFGSAHTCRGCCSRWFGYGDGTVARESMTSILFMSHSAGIAGCPVRGELDKAYPC